MPAHPSKLIVEGQDDLYAVACLMRSHVSWLDENGKPLVYIEDGRGAERILQKGFLPAELKASGLRVLGVLLDANGNAHQRYQGFRDRCIEISPSLPELLPSTGLIETNEDGVRLGLWVMPDNQSPGALEAFLRGLVPPKQEQLWAYAGRCVEGAVERGAECRLAHREKAHLYTWLAWQDEPVQGAGRALERRVLDPQHAAALPFVHWFRRLYFE